MSYEVEYTEEFRTWWDALPKTEQRALTRGIVILETVGPAVPFPFSSKIRGSRHGHMRELRIQHAGRPFRMLYAFDPRRTAVVLIGGDKTGDDRWYQWAVPRADDLYDSHLQKIGALPARHHTRKRR